MVTYCMPMGKTTQCRWDNYKTLKKTEERLVSCQNWTGKEYADTPETSIVAKKKKTRPLVCFKWCTLNIKQLIMNDNNYNSIINNTYLSRSSDTILYL